MHRPLIRALRATFGLAALCGAALAQIDLPDAPLAKPPTPPVVELPEEPRGNLAERVIGRDPYRDPTPEEQEAQERGGLDLPPAAPGAQAPTPAAARDGTTPLPDPAGTIEASPLSNLPLARKDAAQFILGELRRLDDLRNPLIDQATQSLIGLGEDGRESARMALMENRPAVILASAKVLLSSELGSDRELVRKRLRSKLPASVGGPLVEAFVQLDPVGASPVVLAGLLDHALIGVRAAASRKLDGVLDPTLLPALVQQIASTRADTRQRALDLIARFDQPEVLDILVARLGDPSAQVAGRAMILLAGREDPLLELELRRHAFDQPWILRDSAYAILALVEREDARLAPCFDERHVPILLEGMASSDPFVSSSCAAALAGIGFRSTTLGHPEWLDAAVPERLVRSVAGLEFHNDFSSLQRPATRRLSLISGQSFASDGPMWGRWWSESRSTFRARRAVIDALPEQAAGLRIAWRNDLGELDAMRILGPTAKSETFDPAEPGAGEVFRITERQARDLYTLLEQNGVFSVERLPGVRGASNLPGRALDVALGGQGKSFRFSGSSSEPWFETIGAALSSVRERNRWQRYPSPKRHASAEDLWFEQAAWWDEEHSERESALRMKILVLESLPAKPLERRSGGVAELVSIYADPAHVEETDFPSLLGLLQEETYYSPRAKALLGMSIAHLRGEPKVRDQRAEVLVGLSIERFAERAGDALAQILRAAGPGAVRSSASDSRDPVRAVAVRQLVELGETDDLLQAMAMLNDPSVAVRVATIESLGTEGVDAARMELILRARVDQDPAVRSAALWSVAQLGGEGAMDAMVLGLTSPNPQVKVAAARGLAKIGEPSAAPLLVSLLGQGRGSDLFGPAREGLLALGELAIPDVLRAINTPGSRARREGALLLSQQNVPEAVPVLIALLTENANDSLVASELAVITCTDLRGAGNPASAWWEWWEGVVHDDSAAWLCGALGRLGVSAPSPDELKAPATRAGLRFLASVLRRNEPHLLERARRDLGRLLGRELGHLPMPGEERRIFLAELDREIAERFPQ